MFAVQQVRQLDGQVWGQALPESCHEQVSCSIASLTSSDGRAWQTSTEHDLMELEPAPVPLAVAYGEGLYVGTSWGHGGAFICEDGQRWRFEGADEIAPHGLVDVAFAEEGFAAVGRDQIVRSEDGRTWQPAQIDWGEAQPWELESP